MSDYQESTNDDFEDDDLVEEVDETTDSTHDDGLPSKQVLEHEERVMTKESVYRHVYQDVYQTTHLITKYEKPRIIGIRAQMIAEGAPLMVDPGDLIHPVDIARKEYEENKIPVILQRPIPSKNLKKPKYEYRKFVDLQK